MSVGPRLKVQFPHHNTAPLNISFDPKSTIAEAQKFILNSIFTSDTDNFGLLQLKPERWLNPSKTLEYYSLSDGDSISLRKIHQPIKIRLVDGTYKTVLVDTRQSVSEITNSIGEKLGLSAPEEFSLISSKNKYYPQSNRCGIISYSDIEIIDTNLDAEIDDSLCHLVTSQTFQNKTDSLIEALYTFPIAEGFPSVYGFQIVFDDGKTLEGTVLPKEEAEQKYDDAIASGHNANMMKKTKTANSFELELGSIGPNQKLTVKIQCVSRLLCNNNGSILFKFPATLVPAYRTVMETKVDIRVNMTKDIENIQNIPPSLHLDRQTSNTARIQGNIELQSDLELVISTSPAQVPNLALLEIDREHNTCAAMISFVLNKENPPVFTKQSKEIIFIVDRSGSMSGNPIKLVKESLQLFLRSLPLDCYFNIFGFGSTFDQIFEQSQEYNDTNLFIASAKCEQYKADLGCTDLMPVLNVLNNTKPKAQREVFVLTDGQIEKPDKVLGMVKNMGTTRFFTLGLGDGVSAPFLQSVAKRGGGTAEFYKNSSSDSLQGKIIRQLSIAVGPSFRQLSAEWENKDVFVSCTHIENCNEDEVVNCYGLIKPEKIESLSKLTLIRHFSNDKTFTHEIPVKFVTGTDIHKIAITQLADAGFDMQTMAVRYNLITSYTNCLIIEKRTKAIANSSKFVQIEQNKSGTTWLDYSKTLLENIGSLDIPTLDFKKKFFTSDNSISATDPVSLGLAFNDIKQKILDGSMPCSQDDAVQLAALLKTIDPQSTNLPSKYAKQTANVERESKKLVGMTAENAKYRYVQLAKSLRSYGSTAFQSKSGTQQLTVGSNGITIEDSKKGSHKDFQMTEIRRWAVQGNKVIIDTGDADYIQFETNDANQVTELIAGHIDILLKKRKDSAAVIDEVDGVAEVNVASVVSLSTATNSPVVVDNRYLNLIVLCKANGCWELSEEFAKVIGVGTEKIKSSIPEELKNAVADVNVLLKYWATCIALAFLEMEFKQKENEWFMLAAKATEFLTAIEPNVRLFKELAKNVYLL